MITMDTSFIGGNGQLISAVRNDENIDVVFLAQSKWREPQDNWYNFKLSGLEGKTIRLHLGNAEQCLDDFGAKGWEHNSAVYRKEDGEWLRVEKIHVEEKPDRCFDVYYDVPVLGETMQFAFCYPYQVADLQNTMRECSNLKQTVIGYSALGRPMIRIYNNAGDASKEKKGVYIIARQHAGEVGGSYLLDGMLRYLNSEEGQKATENQTWWIVPFADVDGVEEGCYGKDQIFGDFNHSWAAPFPSHVETHAMEHDMDHWSHYCTPAHFSDLHSPGNDRLGQIFNIHMEMGKEHLNKVDRITGYYNDLLAARGFEKSVNHYKFNKSVTSSNKGPLVWTYATYTYDIPSFVVETTYHGPERGGFYTQSDYREMGKCYAKAIAELL